jgi:hypothetical protein
MGVPPSRCRHGAVKDHLGRSETLAGRGYLMRVPAMNIAAGWLSTAGSSRGSAP